MRFVGSFALFVLFVGFSWHVSGVDLTTLFTARAFGNLGRNIVSMFPPKLEADFLSSLGVPILQTIAIAFAGISLALALALPLTFFATRPEVLRSPEDVPRAFLARRVEQLLHYAARGILAVFRTVPELIWALMFVHAIGLGTVPGVLAIAFSYAGVLGKVFAEIIEGVNAGPVEALRATGAGRLEIFCLAVLPQAFPTLLSYVLYRFDCALRTSAVLGLVGAGGLGFQIELSIKMMEYGEVLTELLALMGLVALSDLLSARIRARFATAKPSRRTGRLWVAGYSAAFVLAAGYCGLTPSIVIEAIGGFTSFFVRAFPPESSPASLARFFGAAAETIGISFLGTALALLVAVPLAILGARRALSTSDEQLGSLERLAWLTAAAGARLVLNILRTIPMVIFALIFVPAIGIGPFAGVLAIACHTAGVFGRIYMELIDEVNPTTLDVLRGVGARKAQVLGFAVFPQTLRQIFSFFFYRWEVNLRESVILGIVGGGGIGQLIYVSISLFHEHETYALIILLFLLVVVVDFCSSKVRRWVLERDGERQLAKLETAEAHLNV